MAKNHPYAHFEMTQRWKVLDHAIEDLVKQGHIKEETDRENIVGYLCKALHEGETSRKI